MPTMPTGGPDYFAWVTSSDSTFSNTYARVDEDMFSWEMTHEEGQIPRLTVQIKNPRNNAGKAMGFLRSGANQWIWLSTWDYETETVVPVFFGRLVAIPTELQGWLITLEFIARSNDWISRKQTLADSLKVRPYYDPIFLDDKSRTDPDAVLEGYSAAFHVDRTTLDWTISDILEGSPSETFDGDDIIEGSLQMRIGEAPLRAIRVDAKVNWTQAISLFGELNLGQWVVQSYTDALLQQWPKPGASLGGGWVAGPSTFCVDVEGTQYAGSYSESGSWSDLNTKHTEGDTIGGSYSATIPMCVGITVNYDSSLQNANVGGTTAGGEWGASNDTSFGVNQSWAMVPRWTFFCGLSIMPSDIENPFTETLSFTLSADLQNVFDDADQEKEYEVLDFQSIDVGEALLDPAAWTSVSTVALGQIIKPNVIVGPGGTSYQIAIDAGTRGSEAPLFSDVVGETTVDGSVTWACMGASIPPVSDWQASTYIRAGTVITTALYGGIYLVCISPGITGAVQPIFAYSGNTVDGAATWASLGTGGPSIVTPIGGSPGGTIGSAFFGTDRGTWALEYLICRARAHLRRQSRAFEASCEVPFWRGLDLSCKHEVRLEADDLPGGAVEGKVISYSLSSDGEGRKICAVTVGCAIGNAGSPLSSTAGTPTYVTAGYVTAGYQQETGAIIVPSAATDVSYEPVTPPVITGGFQFPLTVGQVVYYAGWTNNIANQMKAILVNTSLDKGGGDTIYSVVSKRAGSLALANLAARSQLDLPQNSVYFDIALRPIDGQSYETPYVVPVSSLQIPKQVDLSAQ